MFVKGRTTAMYFKAVAFHTALDLVLAYVLAAALTDDGGSALVNGLLVFLILAVIQAAIGLKSFIYKLLYYWIVGRKDALATFHAIFAHYNFPKPDLMEESLESWMRKVVERPDLDFAAKADALMLFSSAHSSLTGAADRFFLLSSVEKAAEEYASR